MNKNIIFSFILFASNGFSQNIGINASGAAPVTSAALDIDMANKGLLIPRVALTTNAAFAPVTGTATTSLLVYNTATAGIIPNNVVPGFYYWDGAKWVSFNGPTSNDWSIIGNTGTTPATNFLGTIDARDLVFRTNNTEKVRVLTNGNVGVGTATPSSKLHVQDGDIMNHRQGGFPINGVNAYGNIPNEGPHFIGYRSRGTQGTPTFSQTDDLLATFQGREVNGIGLGLAAVSMFSSENHSAAAQGARIDFNTTLNGTIIPTTKMTILGNGNVGIGVNLPVQKLHVKGDIKSEINGGNSSGILLDPLTSDLPKISFRAADNTNRFEIVSRINAFTNFDKLYLRSIAIGPDFVDTIMTLNGGTGGVGIGTTNPTVTLDVAGVVSVGKDEDYTIFSPFTNNTYGSQLRFSGVSFNTDPVWIAKYNLSTDVTYLRFNVGDNANLEDAFQFGQSSILPGGFQTFMHIEGNGNVGIGTTTPTQRLHVIGNILASGTITPSDARYKTDVKTLNNSLSKVLTMRGVSYQMKQEFKDKGFGEGTQIGVIAQEVEKIYPELVNTSIDGYKGVDYSKFTPILIEAMKEQQLIIDDLSMKIEAQKQNVEQLQQENSSLKAEMASKEELNQLKAEIELLKSNLGATTQK